MKDLRRIVIATVIGSFSLAALLGIIALLGGGNFGETEGQILTTTVVIGLESLAVLCYLALAGHRLAVVGALGGFVSVICTGAALWLVWADWDFMDDSPMRLFFSTLVIALTLAQASLLIAAADRHGLRGGLTVTLGLATVVAVMLVGPIVTDDYPGDTYWRMFGVVAILDVLGTIVLIAMGVFGRRTAIPAGLGNAVTQRIAREAEQRGTTPDDLVTEALDAFGSPADR